MATTTNRFLANALRGQSVIVTVDSTEAVTKLPNITVGQQATIGSSSRVGYVESVDLYGMSYKVTPKTPNARFDSTALGFLSVSEVITLV